MQCQEMAYSIGMKLNIPTVNIDHCIVEALCVSECPAKMSIVSAINESYELAKRHATGDFDDDEQTEGLFRNSKVFNLYLYFYYVYLLSKGDSSQSITYVALYLTMNPIILNLGMNIYFVF